MGLLSVAIWLPIVGGALLSGSARWPARRCRGCRRMCTRRALDGACDRLAGFPGDVAAGCRLRHHHGIDAVRREAAWIDRFNVHYHLGVDGISMWFVPLTAFITVIVVIAGVGGHHGPREPVHGRLPDPVGSDGRRVLGARWPAVLRVLRGHADPDVHHHRHLGRPAARVRGVQVLPLHAAGFAADAGGAAVPVLQVGRQLRHPHLAQAAAADDDADAALLRLLRGLLGQGADVARAHLAARCARRSAHRRFGGAGGHHAEAGRLRLPALFDADRAGRSARV